jgi:hypothetical protein
MNSLFTRRDLSDFYQREITNYMNNLKLSEIEVAFPIIHRNQRSDK